MLNNLNLAKEHQKDILALIVRNLIGQADSVETAQLRYWIMLSSENRQYFEQVRNIWDAADRYIDPKKINTAEALNKVLSGILKESSVRNYWHYWQKIAAVIILLLVLGTLLWIYIYSKKTPLPNELVYNEVYAAFGTRSSLLLADSTLVWLNSGSSLKYPIKFTGKNRHVFLKGEAYFEVKCDVHRPFIVQTSALNVKATGTKFNVNAYDSKPVTEVTLVSGKIFVMKSDNNNQFIAELNPNQHLVYNRQNKLKYIVNDDAYKFIAWKDGMMIFRNATLDEILDKLSMTFNVDIELKDNELQNYKYRATFKDESLEEILKLLKLSSPIDFTEVERKPLSDGSFPKRKVIISSVK